MSALPPHLCPKCRGERPWITDCPVCDGSGVVWPPYPVEYEENSMRVIPLRKCMICGSVIGPFAHVCLGSRR